MSVGERFSEDFERLVYIVSAGNEAGLRLMVTGFLGLVGLN